jgi:hypothetical protein
MSGRAILMMVIVLTLVWGGFAASVAVGISREKRKARGRNGREQVPARSPSPGGD